MQTCFSYLFKYCVPLSFKEQQLKKIKAKQKRLQAILGGEESFIEANNIEFEADEGKVKRYGISLPYFWLCLIPFVV